MPTTTNFGWTTPADTDLVKDGASAMRTLGNGIDTSLVYLKGGTTGQILSKTSNTDLAFTWINNDQGDITGVTAGTGLSGGGTSGAVSLAIDTATTVDKTTAQTLTNKTMSGSSNTFSNISLTTSVTGTLPIGNGGTNLTTYTTGDLPYASATNTLSKLGIGTTGQILTVASGLPSWVTPAASASGLTLITSTTVSAATSKSIDNCFTSTYDNYLVMIVLTAGASTTATVTVQLRSGGTSTTTNYSSRRLVADQNGVSQTLDVAGTDEWYIGSHDQNYVQSYILNILNPQKNTYSVLTEQTTNHYSGNLGYQSVAGQQASTTQFDGFALLSTANMTGTIRVYGYQNS